MSAKKFVINNNLANLTKSHIVQLFKPSYNPKMDDFDYVTRILNKPVTDVKDYFNLQYFPLGTSSTSNNLAPSPYNTKNIVAGMFLVTENFLTFINNINKIWYNDTLPRVITPVTYTAAAPAWNATADTSFQTTLINIFKGNASNAGASKGLGEYEAYAETGVEGHASNHGVVSSSIHELFLRHLYSIDATKREIAFTLASTFYGVVSAEITAAKREMIPAEDFDSDQFLVSMNEDVVKFEYNKPIKLQSKYTEAVYNPSGKKLYLYFPYITSNAMRLTDKLKYGYRNYISLFTGYKDDIKSNSINPGVVQTDPTIVFKAGSFTTRKAAATGIGALTENADMPTLTNSIYSKVKDRAVNQAGYTALNISAVGQGGDIQFDHVDKIDYLDSLTIEIKAPTVFS